jgi:hypothetical protein
MLPRVSDFQAWNEPNLPDHLAPQWARTRAGYVPASPAIYRALLDALYASVKSVQPQAFVLAGALAPYGDPPGVDRMRPVTFLRELACLRGAALRRESCPARARFDAIDIHPYSLTPTLPASNADDVSVPNIGRLWRVLAAAQRARTVLPGGRKSIWMTEIAWDSSPPDPAGVSLATQARFLSRAFYELWGEGVGHVFWYEAIDPGGNPVHGFTAGGLFFGSGQAKPSATAFRFPFVAIRGRRGITTLWAHVPAPGRVTIEMARGDGWRPLFVLAPTRGGILYAHRRLRAHLALRARVGTIVSYPWSTT